MKSLLVPHWPLRWALLALLAACGGGAESTPEASTTPLTPAEQEAEGLALCCQLGALCHPGLKDPIGGLVYNCHQLGHENDPASCASQFDECMVACLGGRDTQDAEEHGCI